MEVSVIDTLRYADRLKAAGVETRQAEAMSRALNDELASRIATSQDLDQAVGVLKGELDQAVVVVRGELDQAVGMLRGEIDQAVVVVRGELDQAVGMLKGEIVKVDARVDALDAKVDALNGKFEAQGRYVFLVLALIAALGLYNAVAPHIIGMSPQTNAETAQSARG